jgi:hypothetical protein
MDLVEELESARASGAVSVHLSADGSFALEHCGKRAYGTAREEDLVALCALVDGLPPRPFIRPATIADREVRLAVIETDGQLNVSVYWVLYADGPPGEADSIHRCNASQRDASLPAA